jgi:hypothetical protein
VIEILIPGLFDFFKENWSTIVSCTRVSRSLGLMGSNSHDELINVISENDNKIKINKHNKIHTSNIGNNENFKTRNNIIIEETFMNEIKEIKLEHKNNNKQKCECDKHNEINLIDLNEFEQMMM